MNCDHAARCHPAGHLLWRLMDVRHTLHVTLTEPLVRHVRDQVAVGRYSTAIEVLRDALRLLIERDEERGRGGSNADRAIAHHG